MARFPDKPLYNARLSFGFQPAIDTVPTLKRALLSHLVTSTRLRSAAWPGTALALALLFAGCATHQEAKKPAGPYAGLLTEAGKATDPALAAGLYLSVAESSLTTATAKGATPEERAQSLKDYNDAISGCVVSLEKLGPLTAGAKPLLLHGANRVYELSIARGGKDPAQFSRILAASSISHKTMRSDIEREGVGAPMVGVINTPDANTANRPAQGFAEPVTAIAKFSPASKSGATPVTLSFLDPRTKDEITLDEVKLPVRADFTAPIAFYPAVRGAVFGVAAMIRSDKSIQHSGIFFCEPFDPQKIPVLFVHGLMSSPHAWLEFINEMNANADFRKRYQAWVYFYPTGLPIAGNAYRLRNALADVARHYPLKRNLIVVGHSMGGIISNMQVVNTKLDLWQKIFGAKSQEILAQTPPDSLLRKALIFEANPYITRVIFVATPHLGSRLATLKISEIGASIIRMPTAALKGFNQSKSVVEEVMPGVKSIPNSVLGLSPASPLLKGVHDLKIVVPYNSIIGNRGKDNIPLAKSSDGIVPYWSSHLDGAESELIVPTGHDAFNCPQSVHEVLRILGCLPQKAGKS